MDQLSEHSRHIVEAGVEAALYATPVPLQIFAYRSAQLEQVNMARTHLGAGTLLGRRILELLRIRSAQLGECEPCSQSRKHDSITDDDVACLLTPHHDALTPQEQMAVEFLDRLSGDHHLIDDEFYRRLGEHFTAAQIIELGFTCASTMGLHRFLHPSTSMAIRFPLSATPPIRSILFIPKGRADRFGRESEASKTEALHAIPDLTGIAMGRRPMPFDVGPYDTLDGQCLTVGVDFVE
jgi:alkylhydroperoxidase family enzyme